MPGCTVCQGVVSVTLNELSREVIDAAFEVRRNLGVGLLESAYELALVHELQRKGIDSERQVPIYMKYKGVQIGEGFRIDILVDRRLVVECKATDKNNPIYSAQCLTYLRAANMRLGLVINFGCFKLKDGIVRVANGFSEVDL